MLKFIFRLFRFAVLLALGVALLLFLMMMSGVYRDLAWIVPSGLLVLFLVLNFLRQSKKARRQAQRQAAASAQRGRGRVAPAAVDGRLSAGTTSRGTLGWLWGNGPWPQKAGNVFIVLLCLAGIVPLLVFDGFTPDRAFMVFAALFSLVLGVITVLFWADLVRRNLWIPGAGYYAASRLKRNLLLFPAGVLVSGMLYWLITGINLPHWYTAAAGESEVRRGPVVKSRGSRRSLCRYWLEPASSDYRDFKYCISRDFFDRLPPEQMPATIYLRISPLGLIAERVDLD